MTGEQLYWKLNRIYSSEHNDLSSEMRNAQLALDNVLNEGEITADQIIEKMNQLIAKISRDFEYKTKISTVILNRFWEKEFVEMIPYRQFKAY